MVHACLTNAQLSHIESVNTKPQGELVFDLGYYTLEGLERRLVGTEPVPDGLLLEAGLADSVRFCVHVNNFSAANLVRERS